MVAGSGPRLAQLHQSGATEGQVPAWDDLGGFWEPRTLSAGSLGISAVPGGGTDDQVLTWDDVTGSYGWEDKYPAGASEGERLTWISGQAQWVTGFALPSGADENDLLSWISGQAQWVSAPDPLPPGGSEGEILGWLSGAAQWVSAPTGLQSRETLTYTTATLADLADEHHDVTLAAGYRVLRVTTNCAARVRLYANQGRRVADHDRPASTQPVGNHGCMLDYQSTVADAVDLAPALEGATTDAGTTVPMVIQNRSGAVTAVTVELEWVRTE